MFWKECIAMSTLKFCRNHIFPEERKELLHRLLYREKLPQFCGKILLPCLWYLKAKWENNHIYLENSNRKQISFQSRIDFLSGLFTSLIWDGNQMYSKKITANFLCKLFAIERKWLFCVGRARRAKVLVWRRKSCLVTWNKMEGLIKRPYKQFGRWWLCR